MALNFNVDPYYDDFDPSKNYHRILFKPGAAVQARELTQTQTILQSQISKFADHIFSQNTPVNGGKVTTNLNCSYIKLNRQYSGVDVVASTYKNATIADTSGTILAKVIATQEATGTDDTNGTPPTLVLTYFSGGADGQFTDGMTLYEVSGSGLVAFATTIGTVGGTTCAGKSSVASISEGVFYVRNGYYKSPTQNEDGTYSDYAIGNFVSVQPQTIILDTYNNTPSYRLGLQITETVADYINDSSLLDPAVGASNYQAPGADRYQITLTLTTLPLEQGSDDQFIELLRIDNGSIIKQSDNTVYATIDDYIAKRTYDTNGDFIVKDFNVTPVANTADTDLYDLKIGKGNAYIRGYKVDNTGDLVLTNERARTTGLQNNSSSYVSFGSYFYVDTVKGLFDVTKAFPVDFHCVAPSSVETANATAYNSTLVGSAYMRAIDFDSKTSDANTQSYVYKAFVHDISTKEISGTVSTANASYITMVGTAGKLSPAANAYTGVILSIPAGLGEGYKGVITQYDPVNKTAKVEPTFTIPPDSTSTYSLKFDTFDVESIANTAAGGYTLAATANINIQGKENALGSGYTVLQNKNNPELLFPVGYQYIASISDSSYNSTKIYRNKPFSGTGTVTLELDIPVGLQNTLDFAGGVGALSADAIKENYTVVVTSTSNTATNGVVGSIMDFCSAGNTVTVDAGKNKVTFSSTNYVTPLSVSVIAKVNVTNAGDTNSILRTKTLVSGNTSGVNITGPDGIISSNVYVNLTHGQVYIKKAAVVGSGVNQSLYVPDVKRIVKVIDTKTDTAVTDAMLIDSSYDVTRNYTLNGNQKDSYYDHSAIILNGGAPKPQGNLLVVFDYYSHSSTDGYFSGESYTNENYGQIPSYTASNGKTYNLRDTLDFRPTRKAGTTTFDYLYSANPSTNDTGFYIPQDQSNFLCDYTYYLGRKDRLVLTRDKSFQIVSGNPSPNPLLPAQPEGSLLIANITHDPYTAYLPSETPTGYVPNMTFEKSSHRRWTMNDISELQNRMNNIEYYTALNLAEQNANALQVTDANGLNRFKNGILVDNFTTNGVAATGDKDFNASIDRVNGRMSASQTVQNYILQSQIGYKTMGLPSASADDLGFKMHSIGGTTQIFTLPYASQPLITQQFASSTVSVNPFATDNYEGTCQLNPPIDNWVDNTKQPDLLITGVGVYQQSNTLNTLAVSNWQTITGSNKTVETKRTSTYYLTTTANTQQQKSIQAYLTNLGDSYVNTNGYITDVSVQPYMRAQAVTFRAKGMKVNTPVSAWFDGVNVDKYLSNPDILELTSVSGTFNENDIIGYYNDLDAAFYPIASVVSVYQYPDSTKVRLYLASNFHTAHKNDNNIIKNAFFDTDGNYVTSTAQGSINNSYAVSFNNSGYLSGIGGDFTDGAGSVRKLYNSAVSGQNAFATAYGIWDNADRTGDLAPLTFAWVCPKEVTYDFQAVTGNTGTVKMYDGISGSPYETEQTIITLSVGGQPQRYTTPSKLVKGRTYTVTIEAVGTGEDAKKNNFFALGVLGAATFTELGSTGRYTNIAGEGGYFNGGLWTRSVHPNILPAGADKVTSMLAGGAWYTDVDQIILAPSANTETGFYVGSTISISSSYVNVVGKVATRIPYTFTSTITSYDGPSQVATISPAVNVSIGYNDMLKSTITSTYSLIGTKRNYVVSLQDGGQPSYSTNENGEFTGVFHIPPGIFRTGDRVFRVDNRTVATEPGTATTFAEATFTASGLSTKSQAINFSASLSSSSLVFKRTAVRDIITNRRIAIPPPSDPLAQSFSIDDLNYPNGVFLNSIKLFFQGKPSTVSTPVRLSIVGTVNGYPDGEELPHSVVSLTPDKVKTSTTPHHLDPNAYTEFTFEAPVHIQPNKLYAFLVKSTSPDYVVYMAAQNGTALASSVKVNYTDATPTDISKISSVPNIGPMFESQNGSTWTPEQTRALMTVISYCDFDTSRTPKIRFITPEGLPNRRSQQSVIQQYYSRGLVNDLYGLTTGENQNVHAINVTTTEFAPSGTTIDYTYQTTLSSNTQLTTDEKYIVPGKFACPTFENVFLDDGKGERMLVTDSSNSFSLWATLSSTDSYVSPVIADDGLNLFNIQYGINNLGITNTSISLVNAGTGYSNTDTGNVTVTISAPDLAGGRQAYGAVSTEGGVIQSVYITEPGAGYLYPPTITIADANTTPGTSANVISATEFSPSGGNALARYITRKNTLTVANESEDMRVFFTAYRPVGTNIHVFYRIQSKDDTSTFENNPWQLMTYVNNTGSGFSSSREDLKEYEVAPGTGGVPDNQISYTSQDGVLYTSYNSFAIKIVMTTDDNTKVPFLTDMTTLALPSGTGI